MKRRDCLWIIAILALCGCDDGSRRAVEGVVSYEDNPIEYGEIRFLPQPDGPVTVATISDGRYAISRKQGVPLGKMRVQIKALSQTPEAVLDKSTSRSYQLSLINIPEKYNSASELSVEIPPGSDVLTLDFELVK